MSINPLDIPSPQGDQWWWIWVAVSILELFWFWWLSHGQKLLTVKVREAKEDVVLISTLEEDKQQEIYGDMIGIVEEGDTIVEFTSSEGNKLTMSVAGFRKILNKGSRK